MIRKTKQANGFYSRKYNFLKKEFVFTIHENVK